MARFNPAYPATTQASSSSRNILYPPYPTVPSPPMAPVVYSARCCASLHGALSGIGAETTGAGTAAAAGGGAGGATDGAGGRIVAAAAGGATDGAGGRIVAAAAGGGGASRTSRCALLRKAWRLSKPLAAFNASWYNSGLVICPPSLFDIRALLTTLSLGRATCPVRDKLR